MKAQILEVHSSPGHTMSKVGRDVIRLVAGIGVDGDAHSGQTVKHRSRVARDPSQPNLRQVHLIHSELFDELRSKGFDVAPGMMGENVTTTGVDLLSLPTGTRLSLGDEAVIELTGLRNPCAQLDGLLAGLMQAVLDRDDDGSLIRKAGVMSIVIEGGLVSRGDAIGIEFPRGAHEPLKPV